MSIQPHYAGTWAFNWFFILNMETYISLVFG